MTSIVDGLQCYYNSIKKEKAPMELEREIRIKELKIKELEHKIDKAVDYINHAQNYTKEKNVYVNGNNLLNILQGD